MRNIEIIIYKYLRSELKFIPQIVFYGYTKQLLKYA
jgi:hypothetical protein